MRKIAQQPLFDTIDGGSHDGEAVLVRRKCVESGEAVCESVHSVDIPNSSYCKDSQTPPPPPPFVWPESPPPLIPVLYVDQSLHSITFTAYDHPAFAPPTLDWARLLEWPPPHLTLRRLTRGLLASILEQVEAAWSRLSSDERRDVMEKVGVLLDYAEAMGWSVSLYG